MTQDTLPLGREAFRALLARIPSPYDHELAETDTGGHLFLRVPVDEPDAVGDLERAMQEVPDWMDGRIAHVYLVGRRRTVHVPAYTATPLLRDKRRADALQAAQLRSQLPEAYDAVVYRSAGDPLGLLRLAVRLPRATVAELSDDDLNGLAFAAGHLLDSGQAETVQAVLLVADSDHLRIRPRDFFDDVAERYRGSRRRPELEDRQRPDTAPPVPAFTEGGFPSPMHRIQPVGPPRRHVETVEPILEIEEEVEASSVVGRDPAPSALLAKVDAKRLALGGELAARVLRLNGYKVLTGVYHGSVEYAAAGERSDRQPRKVAVRLVPELTRRQLDQMVLDARLLGADALWAITPQPNAEIVRRAASTRVRVLKPEDVAGMVL